MTVEQQQTLSKLLDEFGWSWLGTYNFVCPATQTRKHRAVQAIVEFIDQQAMAGGGRADATTAATEPVRRPASPPDDTPPHSLVTRLRAPRDIRCDSVNGGWRSVEAPELEIEAAEEIVRLERRLEVYDDAGNRLPESCDGIACRNDTIKMQDEKIDRLQQRVATLEREAEDRRQYVSHGIEP